MKTLGELVHDMTNEIYVLKNPDKFGEERARIAADNLDKMCQLFPSLPANVLGMELGEAEFTPSPSHVICELNDGESMTREKARERWSPSSDECKNCKQCQV